MKVSIVTVARAAHDINKALCEALGDTSQVDWDQAPQWQRHSAINGVALHLLDPHMSPAKSHESWLAQKVREGWRYGKVKNPDTKEHPCFVPFDELPPEMKAKDHVFKAVVAQFAPYLGGNAPTEAQLLVEQFHRENNNAIRQENEDETKAGKSDQDEARQRADKAAKAAQDLEAQASAAHEEELAKIAGESGVAAAIFWRHSAERWRARNPGGRAWIEPRR